MRRSAFRKMANFAIAFGPPEYLSFSSAVDYAKSLRKTNKCGSSFLKINIKPKPNYLTKLLELGAAQEKTAH